MTNTDNFVFYFKNGLKHDYIFVPFEFEPRLLNNCFMKIHFFLNFT